MQGMDYRHSAARSPRVRAHSHPLPVVPRRSHVSSRGSINRPMITDFRIDSVLFVTKETLI
jgi:hypothetical protein